MEVASYAALSMWREHDRNVVADIARKLACLGTDGQNDRSVKKEQDIGALREWERFGRPWISQEF
jgi:hypothetical protein